MNLKPPFQIFCVTFLVYFFIKFPQQSTLSAFFCIMKSKHIYLD
jgi:hypothetical protein